MKDFLNRYMGRNRNLQVQSDTELQAIFRATVDAIGAGIGEKAFRPQRTLNVAVVDSVLTAVARRIRSKGDIEDLDTLSSSYDRLLQNEEFRSTLESGTTDEQNVRIRLELATKAFADIR